MVARADRPGDAPRRPDVRRVASGIFLGWRRLLTAALRGTRRLTTPVRGAASRSTSAVLVLAGFLASPGAPRSAASRRWLATAGLAALALGTALSLALARPTLLEAAVSVVSMPLLAMLRLVVLRLAAPRIPSDDLRDAWAAALLPQAIAVTDPLRIGALAAWAWLTWGALEPSAGAAEARRAVAWAVGAEVAFWVLRWAGGGALMYLVTRG